MNSRRSLGLALLVVGVLILAFGLNATGSFSDSVKEGLTGRYTDRTMWYILGGSALAVLGGGMAMFGGGRASAA